MVDFKKIEKKWQRRWEEEKIFKNKKNPKKKKYYVLEMFPYPSGKLHMGHVRNYALGDSFARYKRMQGYNILYPMGYDSFGLPAENAAIQRGVKPKDWTENCIKMMKEQQKLLGLSYDWKREIATYKPEYYKWNQWIFLQFLKKGLAYKKKAIANWCPGCNTVLANEQVENGKCWRCKSIVEVKHLEQWFFKITDYADELLNGLNELDWPENVKVMQKNWIGRSEGTLVDFKLKGENKKIQIFTTRPDTLFGVTFLVFAPEHPMVMDLIKGTGFEKQVKEFVKKIVIERRVLKLEDKEKEGMFIGRYAINPLNGEEVPIYIANFVLMEYGTGAIMCVPAHDQRDFEFAKKFNIPVKVVINTKDKKLNSEKMDKAYVDEGVLTNSKQFDGLNNIEAIKKINDFIKKSKIGKKSVQYKLRDWLISRQRYWGTPIPVVYCDKCGIVPVPERDLPIKLPEDVDFKATGNPLATSKTFVNAKCPKCGGEARRETDTMDTFVDSSWYFFRYCSPKDNKKPFSEDIEYWMPVDQYIGGIEHAVMHLLYSRFFTKVLCDLKMCKIREPFKRLLCQGMVTLGGEKMSKSKGNVVDPGVIIDKYSRDTARLFILSSALPEKELEWSDKGVESTFGFINKIYDLTTKKIKQKKLLKTKDDFINSKINKIIKEISGLLEKIQISTAVQKIMDFVGYFERYKEVIKQTTYKKAVETVILLCSPFIPHVCEEIWEKTGHTGFVSLEKWPKFNEKVINEKLETAEEMRSQLYKDINEIVKLIKRKPKEIQIFVSKDWKYKLYEMLNKASDKRNVKELMNKAMGIKEIKINGKEALKIIQDTARVQSKLPSLLISKEDEITFLKEEKDFIEKEFNCRVEVIDAEKSKELKANQALPMKPGILIN